MKVLGHLSLSKRMNTNHPWFHLAIFGLSFLIHFDGIILKKKMLKMLGKGKVKERKSWHHSSLIRLWWMTIVKSLFSYLSSPHVLTQPLMGADHVTIVTTLSHFCHEATFVRDTRDTCQCIFSPSGHGRDQQVSQRKNIAILRMMLLLAPAQWGQWVFLICIIANLYLHEFKSFFLNIS